MTRGVALLISLSAVAWLTPSLFGQYPPYPYAPPVYGPPPMPYGYYLPAPGPGYYPQPLPNGYYPSAPIPMYPPVAAPRVYVYGPLDGGQVLPLAPPQPAPAKLPDAVKTTNPATPTKTPASAKAATPAKTGIAQAQGTSLPAATDVESPLGTWLPPAPPSLPAPPFFGGACGAEGCCEGGGCEGGYCDSGCPSCVPHEPPQPGHGQFIGEIGANILVPYPNSRTANTTTSGGQTSQNDFPRDAEAGPFVSLGYLCHNGWGIRADYWYLTGSQNQTASNGSLGTSIGNPLGSNFQFTSPSPTLAAGIGTDNYTFTQTLTVNVADLEILREFQCLDTTFLFGAGGRYACITQTYSGTQNNPGGANGKITVAQDQQSAYGSNSFDGFGPTLSLEVIHSIPRSCFSVYANLRGSVLWGNDNFNESLHNQNNTVSAAGASNIVNSTTAGIDINHREVSIGEAEIGVQYGGLCGPVYLFVRAGASFQRWWDVGSPSNSNGNLSFIGGIARIGIAY